MDPPADGAGGPIPGMKVTFEHTLRQKLVALQDELLLAFGQEVHRLRCQCDPSATVGTTGEAATTDIAQPQSGCGAKPPSGGEVAPPPSSSAKTFAAISDLAGSSQSSAAGSCQGSAPLPVPSASNQPVSNGAAGSQPRVLITSLVSAEDLEDFNELHQAESSAEVVQEPTNATNGLQQSLSRRMTSNTGLSSEPGEPHHPFPRFIVRAEIHEACETSLVVGYHRSLTSKPSLARLGARSISSGLTGACGSRYIFRSDGTFVVLWNWLCAALLLKDVAIVPLDVAFYFDCLPVVSAGLMLGTYFTRLVWTIDIPLTFITSIHINNVEVLDLAKISAHYLKSWFLLDVTIVLAEWTLLALFSNGSSKRSATVLHIVRLSRLAHLGRLPRMFHQIRKSTSAALNVPAGTVGLAVRMLMVSFALIMQLHWITCGYYFVFLRADTVDCSVHTPSAFFEAYGEAMYWSCVTLTGGNILDAPGSSAAELAFTSCVKVYLLMFQLLLVGIMCYEVRRCRDSDSMYITRIAGAFLRRHAPGRLTPATARRVQFFVNNYHRKGISDWLRDEDRLLQALPDALRMDLNFEIRGSMLRCMYFFAHIDTENNRVLREVADKVMAMTAVACKDTVFVPGEPGAFTYICSEGGFSYILEESRACKIKAAGGDRPEPQVMIEVGDWLSEASLWTHWEHCGQLVADVQSMLCTLEAELFHQVIKSHVQLGVIVVKYARCFVKEINKMGLVLSDRMDLNWAMQDFTSTNGGSAMDHLAFISHHKEGAGPEAVLIQEGLEKIVHMDVKLPANDLAYPIFIDSENLIDLRHIREHVVRSQTLIVLLTKDVLIRPWCLVEIFTAYENDIPMLPVEIQKAGAAFQYPDEEFYQKLTSGELFSAADKRLLRQEGVVLKTLEEAVRKIFCAIAMPFSPNKPQATRAAELAKIMARVAFQDAGLRVPMPRHSDRSVGRSRSETLPVMACHLSPMPSGTYSLLDAWCSLKKGSRTITDTDVVLGGGGDEEADGHPDGVLLND